MIRAVVFDLDNTLVDFMKMKDLCIQAAVDAMIDAGLRMDKETAKRKLFAIYDLQGSSINDYLYRDVSVAIQQFPHFSRNIPC